MCNKYRIAVIIRCIGFWSSFPASAQQALPPFYSGAAPVNFVRTWDAMAPDTSNANATVGADVIKFKMTTAYLDGLGRPIQTVAKNGSMVSGSLSADLVTSTLYDQLGREQYKYLPFASNSTGSNNHFNDGFFKINAFQQDSAFNKVQFPDESYYYNKTDFEASPLSRPLKTMAAGDNWVGASRGVQTKYWINTATDSIRIWKVNYVAGAFGNYSTTSFYPAGQLMKTAITDENGSQVIEFKDKDGLVILKKLQLSASADTGTGKGYVGWLNTYYIYDSLKELNCVVQPAGVELLRTNSWDITALSGAILKEQCFQYAYDYQGRMIMKKVPGAGTVWMVYDTRDRLVMTQDSLLRAAQQWLYTVYENTFNRPVATGLITDGSNYDKLAYHLVRADTSSAYPNLSNYTSVELTRTFYDDYSWRSSFGNPLSSTRSTSEDSYLLSASNTTPPYPQNATTQSSDTKGMITGTRIKILGTSSYLFTVSFYDNDGRVIQSQAQNITGGTDITTTQYSWNGQPALSIIKNEKQGNNSQTSTVLSKPTYDSLWRVTKIEKKVSNTKVNGGSMSSSWKTTVQNEYDALGQPRKKKIGAAPLDSLNYDFNIRGWMQGINRAYTKDTTSTANWFGFDIGYDKTAFTVNGSSKSYGVAQYNGNIEGMLWKSNGDDQLRKYDFTYDGVNRLTDADFNQLSSNNFSKSAGIDFSVSGLNYDLNGNILNMNQRGWKVGGSQTIDSLLYTYMSNSNRLLNVLDRKNDTATRLGDFRSSKTYMTALSNSKTTSATDYTYDGNGNMYVDNNKDIGNIHYNFLNLSDSITVTNRGNIKYVYDASGNKLKKVTTEGSKVTTTLYLLGNFINDTLQFLPQEEGRIRYNVSDSSLQYDYFIKDHLGNVRMVLTEHQQTDSYPACTMELVDSTANYKYYSNVASTRSTLPSGYPVDTSYSNPNQYVSKVSGSGNKIGSAIILKVMAGDKFNLHVSSWYNKNGATPQTPYNPLTDLITALTNSIGNISGVHGTISELTTNNTLNPGAIGFYSSHNSADSTTKPKAFVNWVLFDEQFNYVSANSGFEQVGGDNTQVSHTRSDLPINKNGYLYIYVSNETPNIDVFFDNLQVTHVRGPLVSEDHYYPFGERMYGICSEALNFGSAETQKKKYNGIERENDLSVEIYDAQLRDLDGQIGRWWQVDPKIENMEMWSPYASNYDNPLRYSDPLGDEGQNCCLGILQDFWDGVTEKAQATWHAVSHPGETLKNAFTWESLKDNALNVVTYGLYSETKSIAKDGPAKFAGGKTFDAAAYLLSDGLLKGVKAKIDVKTEVKGTEVKAPEVKVPDAKGLGNPFKNTTLKEVRNSFEKRAAQGTMDKRGPNAYVNKKSGYSYNVDKGGNYGRGGKKIESPHIDVNYPNPKPKNVPTKKKLDVKSE